jgi:hypothetical protein
MFLFHAILSQSQSFIQLPPNSKDGLGHLGRNLFDHGTISHIKGYLNILFQFQLLALELIPALSSSQQALNLSGRGTAPFLADPSQGWLKHLPAGLHQLNLPLAKSPLPPCI